jgi:hypothetical protein
MPVLKNIKRVSRFLLLQGPCSENQEFLVRSDALSSINNIITSGMHKADELLFANDPSYVELRGQAALLVAAFLEGRHDQDSLHSVLAQRLEFTKLAEYGRAVEIELLDLRKKYLTSCDLRAGEQTRMKNLQVRNNQELFFCFVSVFLINLQ